MDERGGGDPQNVAARALRLGSRRSPEAARRRHEGPRPGADHRERRRDRALDRRAGRLLGHLPRDQRRGSAAHPQASGDDDRVRRRDADLRRGESASAQLRHVRARARPLRARAESDHARGRGPEDVGVSRRSASASPTAACCEQGMKADIADLRSRHASRDTRDVRAAAPVRRRRQHGDRQRRRWRSRTAR